METIYFIIEQPYSNYVKIGKTNKNIIKRLSQLQTGNPNHLNVLFTIVRDKSMKIETLLHKIFCDCRINGEWFKMEQEKLLKLKKLFEGKCDTDNLSTWIETCFPNKNFGGCDLCEKINYMFEIGLFDEYLRNEYYEKIENQK